MTRPATSRDLQRALLVGPWENVVVFRVPENNDAGYRDIMALASQTTLKEATSSRPEELHVEAPYGPQIPQGLQHAYERLGIVGLISGDNVPFVLVTATGSFPLKEGFTVTPTGMGVGTSLVVDMH